MASPLAFIPQEGHDYYDVDSIKADEFIVPCTLIYGCTGVGPVIDPSTDANDLSPGATVEIPLWMVPTIARRGLTQVSLPIVYSDTMRKKLKAGPGCEDLHRCPYFYTAALRVHSAMQSTGTADESLPGFIAATCSGRYRELLTMAPRANSDAEVSAVQGLLTQEERKLFDSSLAARSALDRFNLNKATTVSGGRGFKRKWGAPSAGQENKAPAKPS